MSMRTTTIGLGLLLIIGSGVAWWNISNSQTQTPALAQAQAQAQAPNQTQTQAQNFDQNRAFLENERNTIDVVQRTGEGVVYVAVRSTAQNAGGFDFFGFPSQPREGTGSGFVLDQEGLILTNNHVIQGADQITVKFHNDPKNYPAKVVGTAEPLDLALIKVQAPKDKLKPMPLADSDQVRVGQKAIAIGNPFGLEFTVTEGIISAIRRNPGAVGDASGLVPSVIQTDAAINPGNSGGPLLNSRGEVIGINTAIYSTSSGLGGQPQSAGIGFSIPINLAKQYLADLKAGKKLTANDIARSRPRLGVTMSPPLALYPNNIRTQNRLPEQGLMVQAVERGGPGEKAGLRAANRTVPLQTQNGDTVNLGINGDVIIEADGVQISEINDLRGVLLAKKAGEAVVLKVWREGKTLDVKVVPQIIK